MRERYLLVKYSTKKQLLQITAILTVAFLNGITAHANVSAGANAVTEGMSNLLTIVTAFTTGVGVLFVAWGVLEWGQAMGSQDGTSQAHAIRRIAGGIVVAFAGVIAGALV